jgi:hypothetical protein
MQVWQQDEPRSWDDGGKDACKQTMESADVFLVHASNACAVDFARDCCPDKYVIFYSGAGKGILETNRDLTAHCRQHAKHCICREQITADIRFVDWDLGGCLKAIQNNDPTFCWVLNKFSPQLEAKLNLLYACLDQRSLVEFLENTKDPYGWSTIEGLTVLWAGKETYISEVVLQGKEVRRVQDIDLPKLRDALLED